MFSLVLVLFAGALAVAVSRGVALAVLAVSVASPWVVSSAHNLYWVPWTWLLPAVAAAWMTVARTRWARTTAGAGVAATVALKAATGYEYITAVLLLAAAVPILAVLVREGRPSRAALLRAAQVLGLGLLGFLAMLVVHTVVLGDGSVAAGIQGLVEDATRRTYGAARSGLDPTTIASLRVSPLDVVRLYLFGWQTDLLDVGVGTPLTLAVGRWGLLLLGGAALVLIAGDAVRRRPRALRNALLITVSAAPTLSWLVLAKSHAYSSVAMTFVLWYLPLVPILVWVLGDAVRTAASPITVMVEAEPVRRGGSVAR